MKELENCRYVKTILMILVLVYHSCVFWAGGWIPGITVQIEARQIVEFAGWLSTFHIYGFTLVSGYLLYFLKYEKGKYSSLIPFVVNKAKRLLVPYVFVSAIWAIPFAMYYFHFDAVEVIKRYVLGTSPNQLWFLLMLFFVFMIFYPLMMILASPGQHSCNTRTHIPTTFGQAFLYYPDIHS